MACPTLGLYLLSVRLVLLSIRRLEQYLPGAGKGMDVKQNNDDEITDQKRELFHILRKVR